MVEEQGVVKVRLDLGAFGYHPDAMPLAELGLGDFRRRDQAPLAVYDRVEAEVVLERVGPGEEIVPSVPRAEDNASAGVFLPGNWSKLDGDVDVVELPILQDRDGPRLRLRGLGEHLAAAGWAAHPPTRDELPLRVVLPEILFHGECLPRCDGEPWSIGGRGGGGRADGQERQDRKCDLHGVSFLSRCLSPGALPRLSNGR